MRLSLNRAKPALLNADTAWKMPCHVAVPHVSSYVPRKRRVRIVATTDSTTTVTTRTPRSTRRRSPSPTLLVSLAAVSRVRTPIRRERNSAMSEARVMIPKPPTWISARMTTCPVRLQ